MGSKRTHYYRLGDAPSIGEEEMIFRYILDALRQRLRGDEWTDDGPDHRRVQGEFDPPVNFLGGRALAYDVRLRRDVSCHTGRVLLEGECLKGVTKRNCAGGTRILQIEEFDQIPREVMRRLNGLRSID